LHFTDSNSAKYKWIKTGIEFYEGKAWVSTVGCDAWSDWSVVPMPFADRPSVTIEVVKKGVSLWVYWIVESGGVEEKIPLRELNWVFAEEDWNVGVGAFVARETKGEGKDELTVEFGQGIKIETSEE
jgi:regulation of enolase protein 1 (concanavalin A-like superfamily)